MVLELGLGVSGKKKGGGGGGGGAGLNDFEKGFLKWYLTYIAFAYKGMI